MKTGRIFGPVRATALVAMVAGGSFPSLTRAQDPAPTPTPSSAAAAQATGVKVTGTDVPVPSRRKYVAPEYPAEAAVQGIRGIVILELLIGEDGRVESARVTRSIAGLDEAAIAAVKLWEYEPTKVAGKPVKVLHSQGITFAMRLPDLQRAPGIPELKSGGAPFAPPGLPAAASASIMVTLGPEGDVREAAYLEGDSAVSDSLLRVVRAWRFVVPEGTPVSSFKVRAEWKPGPPPSVSLSAAEPQAISATDSAASGSGSASPAVASPQPAATSAPLATAQPTPTSPAAAEPADTEVLTARAAPPAREEGMSLVADVLLGENIPELARGRRPVWPPMARLGSITGEVVVRFSVDLAGKVTVHSAEGPELLKASAEQAAGTWTFRRTAIDRLNLIATFSFTPERAIAKVTRVKAL